MIKLSIPEEPKKFQETANKLFAEIEKKCLAHKADYDSGETSISKLFKAKKYRDGYGDIKIKTIFVNNQNHKCCY